MIGGGFGGIGRVGAKRSEPRLGIITHRKVKMRKPEPTARPRKTREIPAGGVGVRFVAPFLDGSGYAEGARQWLAALVTAGVDVRAEPVSFEEARADYGMAGEITKKAINREINCKISMIYLTPDMYPLYRKEGHYNIGLFEWETDRLPSQWIHECNAMDEIWVPCQWVAAIAKAGGIKIPIRVFGHCANPEEYRDIAALDFRELPKGCFKFYSIFQWTERKNPEGLLRAYLGAFRRKDPVVLILKTYRNNYSEEEQREITREVDKIKRTVGGKQPRILLITGMLDHRDILSLHATGDCFVLPHRGEGWGLPHFDACMMGKPVITTRFGGNLEYMDETTAFLVNYRLVQASGKPVYSQGMLWADPDIKEFRKYLRYVYSHPKDVDLRARKMRRLVHDKYSYNKVGCAMKSRLTEIIQVNDRKGPSRPGIQRGDKATKPESNIPAARGCDISGHVKMAEEATEGMISALTPGVLWDGVFEGYSGYAKVNRELMFRVSNHLNVQAIHAIRPGWVSPVTLRVLEYEKVRVASSCPYLRFFGPDVKQLPEGRRRINFTMMETEDVHPDMVELVNRFDELWTPTQWGADAFCRSGVTIPIRTIPFGVDSLIYRPLPNIILPECIPLSRGRTKKKEIPRGFLFLSVGLPSARKGFDFLARAFEDAFSNREDVSLVCAVTHSTANAEAFSECAGMRSRIYALEGCFDEYGMARVYSACNAYVSASRGEGWNLPMIEAAACGLPVIVPRNTTHPEVSGGDGYAFLFDDEGIGPCPAAESVSPWYRGMPFSVFGKKSHSQLVDLLRLVEKDRREAGLRASKFRNRVLSELTWNRGASAMAHRLLGCQ